MPAATKRRKLNGEKSARITKVRSTDPAVGKKSPRHADSVAGGTRNFGWSGIPWSQWSTLGPVGLVDSAIQKLRTPDYISVRDAEVMLKDSTMFYGDRAIGSMLLTTDFNYENPSPEAKAVGFFLLQERKRQLLRAGWHSITYSRCPCEIVWGVKKVTVTVIDGETPSELTLERCWYMEQLRDLEPDQVTVYRDQYGDLARLEFDNVRIPRDRVILFVNGDRFGRLSGYSHFRAPWRPWRLSLRSEDSMALYVDRWGSPATVVWSPDVKDWNTYTDQDIERDSPEDPVKKGANTVARLRDGGVVGLPSTHGLIDPNSDMSKTYKMFDIKVLEEAGRSEQFVTLLSYLENKKLQGMLCGSIEGQAEGKALARMVYQQMAIYQEEWAEAVNHQYLQKALEQTLGADVPEGRIIPGMIAENKREILAKVMTSLGDAQMRLGKDKVARLDELIDLVALIRDLGMTPLDPKTVAHDPMENELARGGMKNVGGRPQDKPGAQRFDSDTPEARMSGQGSRAERT